MRRTFCIVYSNLTLAVFAWEGTPRTNKKYLGNREIIATVQASTGDEAMTAWRDQRPASQAT